MAAEMVVKDELDFAQFLLDFKRVKTYLDAQKSIIDAHIVDFFTSNHWDTLVSPNLAEDLLKLSETQLCSLHSISVDLLRNAEFYGNDLLDFIVAARSSQLKSFSWLKDRCEFASGKERDFISHVMAPKKAYEVKAMADVVYFLSEKYSVRKVLDLGSGKGYLSQSLALQYGLPVVGVDSSDNNTQSAQKRNEKLLKAWRGLLKKSKSGSEHQEQSVDVERKQLRSCCNDSTDSGKTASISGFSEQQCQTPMSSPCQYTTELDEGVGSLFENPCSTGFGSVCENCELDSEECACAPSSVDSLIPQSSEMNNESEDFLKSGTNAQVFDVKCFDRSRSLGDDLKCEGSLDKRDQSVRGIKEIHNSDMENKTQSKQINSFIPVTGFVDKSLVSNGELEKLFHELGKSNSAREAESTAGLFIIGLHTCGDLAPTALKLFTSEPDVKLLCLVGCCYHLLTQQFDYCSSGTVALKGQSSTNTFSEDYSHPDDHTRKTTGSNINAETDPGFPMSQYLKQQHFTVSRNATMVAQQAADRVASETKLPPISVLHRAILQVILKEKFGLDGRGMHVGKIASKCRSFTEYVRTGLNKLGLQDLQHQISDEEILVYLRRYEHKLNQIQAFHQLRVLISPCIESIFLMDRLCYLYEQGFPTANIVQLFDAVKSPRCYAIIATKD